MKTVKFVTRNFRSRIKVLGIILSGIGIIGVGIYMGYNHADKLGLKTEQSSYVYTIQSSEEQGQGLFSQGTRQEKVDLSAFWEVWRLVQQKHVDRPGDSKQMIYGAINGILQFGFKDQFSSFLEPELNSVASEDLSGSFAGVGIELEMQNGQLTIVAPLSDTPGEAAGLLAGDKIMTIDGNSTADQNIMELVYQIRGPIGTDVVLGISRPLEDGSFSDFDVAVTRDLIDVKSVRWEDKGDGIYYIKARNFAADTIQEWDTTVSQIADLNPRGVILDLRNNAGGYVTGAVHFISEFIPTGVAVTQDMGAGNTDKLYVSGDGLLYDVPLVVLINRGTASASEMVAGAIQDYERGELIGVRTFGKGVLQEIFYLDVEGETDPASVRIVTARWYTPDDRSVVDVGLEPDIEVKTTLEQYENDEDPVLERALEILE